MKSFRFFAVIIGTEILNRRREDAHFDFVSKCLADKGYRLSGSFTIEDEPRLLIEMLRWIGQQEDAILFCFGGIGSTPDDYTRQAVATAFGDGVLYEHQEAKGMIEGKLGKRAYPHAIRMAQLPKGSTLLHNVVNGMPAFSLEGCYFFMPGFPEMSHPMVTAILEKLIPTKEMYYRYTLTAYCKESALIDVMERMPDEVEFSSLPQLDTEQRSWRVVISVASRDKRLGYDAFGLYTDALEQRGISYEIEDTL